MKQGFVLVTGGTSFVGSHLVDRFVSLGWPVRVIDNFGSGWPKNLSDHVSNGVAEVFEAV